MSYQKESFGMMDQGYFVPRGQLIDWMNTLLDLNITKIEQLGAGSVYCQIVDVIHPGKVTMSKVNWKAKNDYEFINNMKILQTAFDKAGVKRYVDVQKLIKCKYQDNLQFIQWLKRYYDLNCGGRGNDYDPRQRRGNVAVDLSFADKNVVPKSFNSVGQVISKNQLPGKKVPQVLPTKVTTETRPKVQQKPFRNEVKRQQTKAATVKLSSPKDTKWEELYHQQADKNQELNLKLGMIQQILQSHDDSNMKIAMLEEIMNVSRQNEKMEIQGHNHEHDEEQII